MPHSEKKQLEFLKMTPPGSGAYLNVQSPGRAWAQRSLEESPRHPSHVFPGGGRSGYRSRHKIALYTHETDMKLKAVQGSVEHD